jgi:hypothetical protein
MKSNRSQHPVILVYCWRNDQLPYRKRKQAIP